MPTGYTGELSEGEITFNQYLWRCARAFGPLFHMRDASYEAPISLPRKETYYSESARRARSEIKRLESMSKEDLAKLVDRDYQERRDNALKTIEKMHARFKRYQAMLVQVKAWEPPAGDYTGLKDL